MQANETNIKDIQDLKYQIETSCYKIRQKYQNQNSSISQEHRNYAETTLANLKQQKSKRLLNETLNYLNNIKTMVRCSTIADIKYEEFKEEDGNSDDDDVFYDAMDEDIPQILVELNGLQE